MSKGSLVESLRPTSVHVRTVSVILGGAVATALGARLEVPVQPVPFTLQTFAVFTASMLLGARQGALAQLAYLAAGATGLGVFAGGAGGFVHLVGPTGGYLLSYVPAAFLMGALAERGWSGTFAKAAAAMALGSAVVFGIGVAWLACFVGIGPAVVTGCLVFLPSEALKIAVAGLLVSGLRRGP